VLLAWKLRYPRRSNCVSRIDQRTKLGVGACGLAIPKIYPPRQRRLSQPRKERHFVQCRWRPHHDHLRARNERDFLDSWRRNFLYHQMRNAPVEERRNRHSFRLEQYRTLDNRITGAGCCSLGAHTPVVRSSRLGLARFQHCVAAMYSGHEKQLPAPNSNIFIGRFMRRLSASR
jgi:hypothetical protein